LIKDLAAREDGTVRVSGWVEKVRDQRYVQFVVLRDETGAVQLVNGGVLREADPENPRSDILVPRTTTISELTQGSFVTVVGELQHNERVKLGGVEIQIEEIDVVAASLPDNPVAGDSGIDVRLGVNPTRVATSRSDPAVTPDRPKTTTASSTMRWRVCCPFA